MATAKPTLTKKKAKQIKRAIRRKYKGPDSYMLETGQTLHDLFLLDKADFLAKVPDLADPFVTNWQTAITAAVNYTDDSVILGQIAPQTLTVTQAMQAGKDKYNEIIFYAERHFGKASLVLKEFGKGSSYEKAARSQEKMFEFLDELSTTANKYKTELIAKGCTQDGIDEIADLRDALNTSNRVQNLAIKGRPVISEGRTKAYNTAFAFSRSVLDAAPEVYKNQPAKLGQYRYNPPVKHRNQLTFTADAEPNEIIDFDTQNTDPKIDTTWLVKITATGTEFTVYVGETTGTEPGDNTLQVTPTQPHTNTLGGLATQLGGDQDHKHFTAKNTGTGAGQIKIVVSKPKKKK